MKSNPNSPDIERLIAGCKRGSHKAQVKIYDLYYSAMYNVAVRMLNDSTEAEDVMQESFLAAFQKLETYKGEVSFGAWLKRIVINRALDLIKSRRAIISLDAEDAIVEEKVDEPPPYKSLSMDQVKKAMKTLPDGFRVVLSLYLIEGYDHDEISQILGIKGSTSRTQYHRARKHLVKQLNELKAVS